MDLKEWWESPEGGNRGGISACEHEYKKQGKPCGHFPKIEFRELIKEFRGFYKADKEIITKNVEFKLQTQKFMDTNRIERKSFREFARISNALEEYNKELISNLVHLKPFTIKHEEITNKKVGIIQLSDLHFNELIDIEGNKYDFEIASKRLKLLAEKAKLYFNGISKIVVAFTGDILNSDRRLDEKLNQATNRAKATLLSFYLLEQFICDLNNKFNVVIASVSGNEGRANEEMGYSEIIATDNYDFTIFCMLLTRFKDCKGIDFIEGNNSEKIINLAGQNILLLHGLSIKQDIEKSIQQIIGKYATKGIIIDYVFLGHIHSARIGDLYCRASSLCGANAFSDYALNLAGRASQNIGIFYDNKTHDVIKIDLQCTDNVQGYEIIKELERYNAKSVDKCKVNVPVFQVVI